MADTPDHPNVTVEQLTPDALATRSSTVDFLYLDREECSRCSGTESAILAALDRVTPVVDDLDVEITLRRVHVETHAQARRVGLTVSPTVRVDGLDVQPDPPTSACEDCAALGARESVPCREWAFRGETHAKPPAALFVAAILRGALVRERPWERIGESDRVPIDEFFSTADGDPCC